MKQAIKIWWSFMWRAWLATMPAMIFIFPLMYWIMPVPKPGQPPQQIPPDAVPGFVGKFFLVWMVMMGFMVLAQAFAIRWMLKTKWSDFRLVVVKPEEAVKQP